MGLLLHTPYIIGVPRLLILSFFQENICCGYSLEVHVSHSNAFTEQDKINFHEEI